MRWPPPAREGEVNFDFVDRFTFAHAAIGVGYALAGLSVVTALLLAVAWEIAENPLKVRFPAIFPHATRDTLRNAVGDVLAVAAGSGLTLLTFSS